jgi:hypothetical protein
MRLAPTFALLLLLGTLSASAQSTLPFEAERVLLPITVTDAPGAYGTRWSSELWFRTETQGAVYPVIGMSACDPPCPDGTVIPENSSHQSDFFRTHAGETSGMLLYVDKARSSGVHISLRLNETSGLYRVLPLQLPVVREREFTTGTVHILGIPVTADNRPRLRVYGIDPALAGNVRVRIFAEDPELPQQLLGDRVIALTAVPKTYGFANYTFDLRPPVAELDLAALLPGHVGMVRLEITPVTPGLSIWGFVSLTDNLTQAITLRTPN